jgi:hypothetical protein
MPENGIHEPPRAISASVASVAAPVDEHADRVSDEERPEKSS